MGDIEEEILNTDSEASEETTIINYRALNCAKARARRQEIYSEKMKQKTEDKLYNNKLDELHKQKIQKLKLLKLLKLEDEINLINEKINRNNPKPTIKEDIIKTEKHPIFSNSYFK